MVLHSHKTSLTHLVYGITYFLGFHKYKFIIERKVICQVKELMH